MKKQSKLILITILAVSLTACSQAPVISSSSANTVQASTSASVSFVYPFESIAAEVANLSIKSDLNDLIDLRYITKRNVWDDEFLAYYKDGLQINVFFKPNISTYLIFESVFYFSRLIGLLPNNVRKNIKTIEIFNSLNPSSISFNNSKLFISLRDLDISDKIFTPANFLEFLLTDYFKKLNSSEIAEYKEIITNSNFYISKKSSITDLSDFNESYLFYLLNYYDNTDSSKLSNYSPDMKSRFEFFEKIGIVKNEYKAENIANIINNMVIDETPTRVSTWDYPDFNYSDDISALTKLEYVGIDKRLTEFEYRGNYFFKNEIRDNYIFVAHYDTVNIEYIFDLGFTFEQAEQLALRFAKEIGYLPTFLRSEMKAHLFFNTTPNSNSSGSRNKPGELFYGINLNDPYSNYPLSVLMHKAAHITFDSSNEKYFRDKEWQDAIANDKFSISYYAKDYPQTEDLASTLDSYLIYRYKPKKLSEDFRNFLRRTMYNRYIILDKFDFYRNNN
jgi:hypothetical protein